jgi:hypothetical protein
MQDVWLAFSLAAWSFLYVVPWWPQIIPSLFGFNLIRRSSLLHHPFVSSLPYYTTTKDSLGNGATTTHAAVRHDFHARPAWRGAGKDKKGKEGDGRGGEVA